MTMLFRILSGGSVLVLVAILMSTYSRVPTCDDHTPKIFVVSTSPYVCDFTRGGGSPW
jgi:hypothetical protein